MLKTSAVAGVVGVMLVAWSFMPVGTQAANHAVAAYGKTVFQAKGCAACHAHAAVSSPSFEVGPSLTNYRADLAYLQRWLRDPQAVKPTTMPNLNLSDDEIAALVTFLSENNNQ